jgi:hypothetical protein
LKSALDSRIGPNIRRAWRARVTARR